MKSVIFFLVLVNIITVVYCHVLHMKTYELLKAVAEYVEAQRELNEIQTELNKQQQKTNKIIFDTLWQNPLAGYVNQYIKQMERMKDGRREGEKEKRTGGDISSRTDGQSEKAV